MPTFYKDLHIDPLDLVVIKPGISGWHRLEADPTALDMAPGLEARLADPLWMIGRQWQFGELRGEDAGTPIAAQIAGGLSRLAIRGAAARAAGADAVWEPAIEAEPDAIHAYPLLPAEAGLDFERCLAAEGVDVLIGTARTAFPLTGLDNARPGNRQEALMLELIRGAAIDGAQLFGALGALRDASGAVTEMPPVLTPPPAQVEATLRAATAWLAEWDEIFLSPTGQSWLSRRMEYGFDIETERQGGETLRVEEYADGRLDWWSMDFAAPSPGPSAEPRRVEGFRVPIPVRWSGMPADRYFEFEDGSVNLAATSGGPTSIATMLVLEYMLAASNDWFHIPLTIQYGHGFTLDTLVVTDTFGRAEIIGRAGKGTSGWTMFELSLRSDPRQSGTTFVLPASAAQTLEGDAIEEVALFRDEMANLVWATEHLVPGLGARPATPRMDLQVLHQALDTAGVTDAAYVYRMQTPVPLNWHPMIAVPDPDAELGTVLFQRVGLERTVLGPDGQPEPIDGNPKGVLLKGEDGMFAVEENEVPRAGVVVTRSFQMTRTPDGRRLLWLGRTKRAGRGEGSSGLSFDVLDPIETP